MLSQVEIDRLHDKAVAHDMVLDARKELLAEQDAQDAWDASMTPEERAAAIRIEIAKADRERGNASQEGVWVDPRTANLLGNYITN